MVFSVVLVLLGGGVAKEEQGQRREARQSIRLLVLVLL